MAKKKPITEAEEHRRGANIAILLGLTPCRDHADRFNTSWGAKTAIGLYRIMEAIMAGRNAQ